MRLSPTEVCPAEWQMAERSASLNTSAVAIVTGASQGIGRAASFVSLGISQPACLWLEIGEARKNRMRSGMASAEAMAFYVDLGGPQAAEAMYLARWNALAGSMPGSTLRGRGAETGASVRMDGAISFGRASYS